MKQQTFEDYDKFNRKKFATQLTKIITTFHPFYEEAFVMSLNASYGSGKTTFLKMWKKYLEEKEQGFDVIYINAWKTDYGEEPLIPIIGAFLDAIGPEDEVLKKTLKATLAASALSINDAIAHVTGVDAYKISNVVEGELGSENIQKLGEDIYKEYSFKNKAYTALKEAFSKYIEGIKRKPLIILVDELDRVRPDYSIKFLEAIKHIFSVKGICFVIAVDREQIKASTRQLYGEIDFENYFRRFVMREAQLPEISTFDLMPYLRSQAEDFFDEKRSEGVRFSFDKNEEQKILEFMSSTAQIFRLVPREIKSLFRIFSQFMAATDNDLDRVYNLDIKLIRIAIILIAILIKNRETYFKLGLGKCSPEHLISIFKSLSFENVTHGHNLKQYTLISLCGLLKDSEETQLNEIAMQWKPYTEYSHQPISPDISDTIIVKLTSHLYAADALPEDSAFQKIYSSLEEWRNFLE